MANTASEHQSLGNKIKHFIHPDTKDPDTVDAEKHRAHDSHVAEEARADALIAQRENQEHVHPERSGPPDVVPSRHNLSSMPHRESLEAAAEHKHITPGGTTTPDMMYVTHIPESELPIRHERMENTALRPSDPNDVNSMNGAVDPRSTVAGDDRML
ncbi:hypothetical protein JCM8547_005658 [Rhodosporidiobolus lusitaniae]